MENIPLKVLCLEDSARDVEIMRELLVDAGYDLNMECTSVEKEFAAMLGSSAYDIILADFTLPGFDAFAALRWSKEICPKVPFICVSGSIGEETAVEILKRGAVDYILKDKLARLPSAIERAREEAKEREARQRAEEALKESEQRLRRLYESDLIGVIYWNMNGQITDANDKFLEMVGYSRDELAAGMIDWGNMTPPEFRHLDVASVEELKATGVNKTPLEKEYIRKDGTRVPIYLAGAMLDEKRFNGVAFVLDITERKRAEETLQKSEKRLREAQEMAHLGFWTWDVKTGEVEWSEEVFKIFCLDPKEFTPHIDSILALSPWPEDHHRDQELINKAIETHTAGSYEQKFLRPDQSIGHYYSTFQGNYDEKGDLISIVGTVLDITERKQAEEKILHHLEELRRWQDVTLGREDRNRQLKGEVNDLLIRLGESIRYPSQESASEE